jgi:hypothetical protein
MFLSNRIYIIDFSKIVISSRINYYNRIFELLKLFFTFSYFLSSKLTFLTSTKFYMNGRRWMRILLPNETRLTFRPPPRDRILIRRKPDLKYCRWTRARQQKQLEIYCRWYWWVGARWQYIWLGWLRRWRKVADQQLGDFRVLLMCSWFELWEQRSK